MNEYIKEIEEIATKCSCSQSDGYAQIMRICEAIKEQHNGWIPCSERLRNSGKIVAWQPLPAAWKGVENGKK